MTSDGRFVQTSCFCTHYTSSSIFQTRNDQNKSINLHKCNSQTIAGLSCQYHWGHVTLVFCAGNQKFVTIFHFVPSYLKCQDYMTYTS